MCMGFGRLEDAHYQDHTAGRGTRGAWPRPVDPTERAFLLIGQGVPTMPGTWTSVSRSGGSADCRPPDRGVPFVGPRRSFAGLAESAG